MDNALTFLSTPTNVIFFNLMVAMLLGAVIGTERAILARQSAGMRTFGLVALGSCLFVSASNFANSHFLGVVNFDPMHVASSIVTGIGFIGGGLIIFRGEALHGVTTAAGLWITAAVGVAVGFGMYAVATFTTILTLIMFTGMWYVESRFKHWFTELQENGHSQVHNSQGQE